MPRPLINTQTESDLPVEHKTVGLLVFALRYDDLCAADSMALPPLSREGATLDIGRASEAGPVALSHDKAALSLPDPFLSRAHARITRKNGADYLEDRGSKLGSFINSARVERPTPLADGDLVELGHSLFVYRLVEPRVAIRFAANPRGAEHGPTRTLCPELAAISADLEQLARTDQPVLLLAETGAGKEIAARFVHDKSGRAGPFVAVDCGAIPHHLVEGELFGHKRGAFSGAHEERRGRIRSADGGTIFLDELGNLPEAAQATLLRAIQEREITPVGADRPIPVDVRFIAATNADIFSEESRFRADLRARLAGYVAILPPLRKRREDLGFLVANILAKARVTKAGIKKRAAHALFFGDMQGNIRELERALSSAAVLMGDDPIDLDHLSILKARAASAPALPKTGTEPPTLDSATESKSHKRPAQAVLEATLQAAKGNQGEAARQLGVHERQLARWMDFYGIPRGKKSSAGTE